MAGAEVDLDPGAVRAVAAGLTALVPEIRELCGHVEPAAAAAAHFGAPDHGGLLAAELAARCDEVHSTLSRLGRLAETLAGELRAGADLVATADEHSARTIRSAEGRVTEPAPVPGPDRWWTSDRELDRLAPLATSLQHWAPVYERWRAHDSAGARPRQPPFDRADLSAIDDLRGVHFGRFAAASRWLRTAGDALTRIGDSSAALAGVWRDGTADPAARRLAEIRHAARDCAALCVRLGVHLECALVDTVAAVVTGAVDEIVVRSCRWEQAAGRAAREVCEQRIDDLGAAHPAAPGPAGRWRAELDVLVVDYDAVIGLYRSTLAAAADTVARVYQALHHEIGADPAGGTGGAAGAGGSGLAPVAGAPGPAPADDPQRARRRRR